MTFQAGEATGKIERQIQISTDLGAGAVPVVTVQATVEGQAADAVEPAATQPTAAQTSAVVAPTAVLP